MKNYPSMMEYLAKLGVLDQSDEQIKNAKKDYRLLYRREHKKLQRQRRKEFQVTFSLDEFRIVQSASKTHHRSVTRLIHDAALAYLEQRYLVPDQATVVALHRFLGRCQQDIRAIKIRLEKSGRERLELMDLMRRVEEMEAELHPLLKRPVSIIDVVRNAVTESPAFAEQLKQLLL